MLEEAINKLHNELANEINNFMQAIGNYLLGECRKNNSNVLLKAILNPEKTLKDCANYINDFAKKNVSNNCFVLSDDAVYEKVIYYYLTQDLPKINVNKNNTVNVQQSTVPLVMVEEAEVKEDLLDW